MKTHFILASLFFIQIASASSTPTQTSIQKFVNTSEKCKETDSCRLKSFQLQVNSFALEDKEFQEIYYLQSMFASYQTESIESLTEFAIVQFIRGCMFEVRLQDGKRAKNVFQWRESFGKSVPHRFPDWIIDSRDKDPIYYSQSERRKIHDPERSHLMYAWNKIPGSFDTKTREYLKYSPPPRPELYIADKPSVAYILENPPSSKGNTVNSSLEFKTCIYRTNQIPISTHQDDIHFATPIHCFNWRNSYIYDYDKKEWTHPEELDPFCTEKN